MMSANHVCRMGSCWCVQEGHDNTLKRQERLVRSGCRCPACPVWLLYFYSLRAQPWLVPVSREVSMPGAGAVPGCSSACQAPCLVGWDRSWLPDLPREPPLHLGPCKEPGSGLQRFCDQTHFHTHTTEIHLLCRALSQRQTQIHSRLTQKLNRKRYLKRFWSGVK